MQNAQRILGEELLWSQRCLEDWRRCGDQTKYR